MKETYHKTIQADKKSMPVKTFRILLCCIDHGCGDVNAIITSLVSYSGSYVNLMQAKPIKTDCRSLNTIYASFI